MGRFMVEIRASSLEKLQDLQRVFHVDIVRATGRRTESGYAVDALLSEKEIENLRQEGFQVKILRDAEEVGRQRRGDLG